MKTADNVTYVFHITGSFSILWFETNILVILYDMLHYLVNDGVKQEWQNGALLSAFAGCFE